MSGASSKGNNLLLVRVFFICRCHLRDIITFHGKIVAESRGGETVYTQPSEGCERKLVEVQILSSAPEKNNVKAKRLCYPNNNFSRHSYYCAWCRNILFGF